MNTQTVSDAIGRDEGDYLELSNQWAKVTVTRRIDDIPPSKPAVQFFVSGDILDMRAREKTFPSLSKAMAYAMKSLAAYRAGSPGQR